MGTLSYSYGKRYGYMGLPGTCRWCGFRLPPDNGETARRGYRGNGYFCSLRCGYQWAVRQLS